MATMARPQITLYLDTVSPFAYMAYYILRHDPVFSTCDTKFVPIFLGGLMHKCGNTAPIKIKNKDKWIAAERVRWASAFSIPISRDVPPDFPQLTLPPMRALAVLAAEGDEAKLVRALDVLYQKTWVESLPTHKPETLRVVLGEVFGEEEAERVLTESSTRGKSLLIQNTDAAFDAGAFGLPYMVCTTTADNPATEGFWGVDHLGQVAQFLGLDYPRAGTGTGGQKQGGWRALL